MPNNWLLAWIKFSRKRRWVVEEKSKKIIISPHVQLGCRTRFSTVQYDPVQWIHWAFISQSG
jgi:hemolysin-activating ACP:hemolysin acyltransferase